MQIEILTIGTELLLGFTIDTNGAHLGRELANLGITVTRRTSVPDSPEAIRAGLAEALARTGAVIATGGLGPTRDDMTKVVAAELFGAPLEFREALWTELVARFARIGRVPSPSNRTQAEVPAGATVLPNQWGTAPGLWLEGTPGLLVMLPGVPREMRKLFEHEVAPRLRARGGGGVVRSRVLRTTGIPESQLAERLGDIEVTIAPLSLAYLPGVEGVDLRLTAWQLPAAEADERLAAAAEIIRERAEGMIYGEGDTDLAALVLDAARRAHATLAVAESCTGGLVGERLTAIPGSSDVFMGGIISYANEVKTAQLGVPEALLAEHGAVSEPVVRAMAAGCAERLGVTTALAITGVAGPGGGTEAKPVGTVWIAVSHRGEVTAWRLGLPGSRGEIRARAAQAVLALARECLLVAAPAPG